MAAINHNRLGEQLTEQELQAIREARVCHITKRAAFYDDMLRTVTAERGPGNKGHLR